MSRPHEERTFAENNDNLAGAQEFSQSEPVAEEPAVVGSKKEMNEETVLDKEAVEEAESSSNGDEVAKEKERLEVQRTASNWTQATGTSYASSVQQEAEQAPRKQTWSERLNPLKSRNPPPIPSERMVSREHKAGFFSVLYFQWINPLMVAGYQRPLELNDIWQVNPDRSMYYVS
jgi:ATP-binding cassette, subfamily C (CFTR/MRP), member 1